MQVRFLPGLLRVEASVYGAHRVAIDNTRGGLDVPGPTLGGKLEASERPTTLRGFSLSGGGSTDHWTTIVPVISWPWTAQSYWYVPGAVNVTAYVPLPVMVPLLAKFVEPTDCTL